LKAPAQEAQHQPPFEVARNEAARQRADRDYLDGKFKAASYEGLLATVEEETSAVEAKRQQLDDRLETRRSDVALLDYESEVHERWAVIQEAVAGREE
jgi:hypothetical protein